MKIYSLILVISSFLLLGCFTVPGNDRIVTIRYIPDQHFNYIHPLNRPIDQVEYIPANQSFHSKLNYINECMINYSWGRGWNNRQDF